MTLNNTEQNSKTHVIRKEPCARCRENGQDNTGDNRVVYSDDSYHCFACSDNSRVNKVETSVIIKQSKPVATSKLIGGTLEAIQARNIDAKTCEKYNVRTRQYNGKIGSMELNGALIIYPLYEGSTVVKQKVRSLEDKSKQTQLGDTDNTTFFGQQAFSPSKNIPIIITEGEFDAMCIYQSTGYAAVSGTRGAQGLYKEIQANLEWLLSWKYVILAFDNDDIGQQAVDKCSALFEPQAVRTCVFPLKDANDMVMAGRQDEIKRCLYNAKIIKPDTLVTPDELLSKVLEQPQCGTAWPWDAMTKITYGKRDGELYLVAAATGIGKTEFLAEILESSIRNEEHTAIFSLEQRAEDTLRRLVGRRLNKKLHIPGCKDWDAEEIATEAAKIKDDLVLYDAASGNLTLDSVLINIRYAAKCFNTKLVIIDNLKALATNNIFEGKRVPKLEFMGLVISELYKLCVQMQVTIFVVNHLNVDRVNTSTYLSGSKEAAVEGVDEKIKASKVNFEDGRMPSMNSIYGGTNITDLVDYVIVLARNRNSDDLEERNKLTVKFLKARLDGSKSGASFDLSYNDKTGRLEEQKLFGGMI